MTEHSIHSFRLLLSGPADDSTAAILMDACGDMLLGTQGSRLSADFDRSAATLEDAILTAIRDLEATGTTVRVERVEPDDLVTATVIADRIGRTRQSVSLLIAGDRGPGGFPEPLSFVDAKTRLWRWSEVAAWLDAAGIVVEPSGPQGPRERRFLAALNGALEARTNLGAYSASGGDERAAMAVREIATSGGATGAANTFGDRGRREGATTLTTGIDLLDLAVQVLDDDKSNQVTRGRGEHVYPLWMRTSIAGFAGTLRLYVAGRPNDAAPFEELVAAGLSCAALTRISHHGSRFGGQIMHEPSAEFSPARLKDCPACRGSEPHQPRVFISSDSELGHRTELVSGLDAPTHVVDRISVWLTHTERDHVAGLAAILTPVSPVGRTVTHDWDECLGQLLADCQHPEALPLAEWKSCEMRRSDRRETGWLSAEQRLWATTWSFGHTLRVYTEKASPQKAALVSSALTLLERMR